MVQEEVFLKEGVGGGRGAITFPISFFKALFKFRNYFVSFGNLCFVFEEKLFFLPPYFMQKGHSKLSKMNLEIYH